MVKAMQRVFEAVARLPEAEQEAVAERWAAELAAEAAEEAFDAHLDATAHRLEGMAEAAWAEHQAGNSLELEPEKW